MAEKKNWLRKTAVLLSGAAAAAGLVHIGARSVAQRMATNPMPHSLMQLLHPLTGETITVNRPDGTQLRVVTHGSGQPILLVHGYGLSAQMWSLIWQKLQDRKYRLIAVDLRGHGGSTIGNDGIDSTSMSDDLAAILESLDVQNGVLVGHSTGGFLSLLMGLNHRKTAVSRLKHLVLLSTLSGSIGRENPILGVQVPLLKRGLTKPIFENPTYGQAMIRSALGNHPSAAVAEATRRLMAQTNHEPLLPIVQALGRENYATRLRDFPLPCTIIHGTADGTVVPLHAEEMAAHLPQVTVRMIPGGGHMLNWERPFEVTQQIKQAADRPNANITRSTNGHHAPVPVPRTPEQKAAVNGIEIVYDTFGNPDDTAILLIMGLSNQLISWDDPFCEMLARRGYYVIRYDNRDIGKSTSLDHVAPPSLSDIAKYSYFGGEMLSAYLLTDMADDAVGLLDHLNVQSAHVVGVSMGGMIAQTLAIHHPQRVRTLMPIMSSTGSRDLPEATLKTRWALLSPAPHDDKEAYLQHAIDKWPYFDGPAYPMPPNHIRRVSGLAFDRGLNRAGAGRQLAAIFASGDRTEQLKKLDIPTLVMHGEDDPLLPLPHGIAIAEAVPNAELVIIEAFGHSFPPSVFPRWVAEIDRFAKKYELGEETAVASFD